MDAKYLAPILAVLVAAIGAFSTQFAGLIAAHPQVSAVVAGLGALTAAFAPQPHK